MVETSERSIFVHGNVIVHGEVHPMVNGKKKINQEKIITFQGMKNSLFPVGQVGESFLCSIGQCSANVVQQGECSSQAAMVTVFKRSSPGRSKNNEKHILSKCFGVVYLPTKRFSRFWMFCKNPGLS